jgi:hypothetical protein
LYIPTELHKKILTHTIFIFNRETKFLGSGILIDYQNSPYIITVEHLLKKSNLDEIFIHLGIDNFKHILKKQLVFLDENLDLVFFRLDEFESKILRGHRTIPFKVLKKDHEKFSKDYRIAVCGFPDELANYYKNRNIKNAEPYFFTTTPLEKQEWPIDLAESDKNVNKNIILKYGRKKSGKILNQDKEEIEAPMEPFGMSGGGIWLYKTETENDENPAYGLIGIQTGVYTRRELLVGTLLKDLIEKHLSIF